MKNLTLSNLSEAIHKSPIKRGQDIWLQIIDSNDWRVMSGYERRLAIRNEKADGIFVVASFEGSHYSTAQELIDSARERLTELLDALEYDAEVDISWALDYPEWVESEGWTMGRLKDVVLHKCDSGAYMPAQDGRAPKTMALHGDDVMEFIDDAGFDPHEAIDPEQGFSNWACSILSQAVELWASREYSSLTWRS